MYWCLYWVILILVEYQKWFYIIIWVIRNHLLLWWFHLWCEVTTSNRFQMLCENVCCWYRSHSTQWSQKPFIFNIALHTAFYISSTILPNNKILCHLWANIHCITIYKHSTYFFSQLFLNNLCWENWYHDSTTVCRNIYLSILHRVINWHKQLISILLKTFHIFAKESIISSPLQQIVIKFLKCCPVLNKSDCQKVYFNWKVTFIFFHHSLIQFVVYNIICNFISILWYSHIRKHSWWQIPANIRTTLGCCDRANKSIKRFLHIPLCKRHTTTTRCWFNNNFSLLHKR